MRGNFEQAGTFPLSVAPAAGWGHPNPTHQHVIIHSNYPGQALLIDDDKYVITSYAEATRFESPIDAARVAGELKAAEKLAA